jgi:hypothetical protein
MLRSIGLLLLVVVAVSTVPPLTPAAASAPELVTDRPDQTESPIVVTRGYVQVEGGWTHGEREDGGDRAATDAFPETLVRIGLSDRWELRAGFEGYRWLDFDPAAGGDRSTDGAGDTGLGFKLGLTRERRWRPMTALLATLALPTGDDAFSRDRAAVSFRMAFAHTLSERLGLGYNAGIVFESEEHDSGDRDTQSEFQWTVALGIGATDRLAFFAELFGGFGLSRRISAENGLDGGLTYLVRDNLQLDAFAGIGTTDSADDWFAGLGVSYRFPE